MLSLVNYGSSEESDEENSDNHAPMQPVSIANSINKCGEDEDKFNDEEWNTYQAKEEKSSNEAICKPITQSQLSPRQDNESSTSGDDILSKLPPPVSDLRSIPWEQLSKLTYKSRAVRIMAPSIPEDSEEKKEKKVPSKTGSGLLAMLPKPKNEFVAKPYSLKPTSVASKKQPTIQSKPKPIPKPKFSSSVKSKGEHLSDSEGEDGDIDFFSLSTPSLPVVHNSDGNLTDISLMPNLPLSSTEVSLVDVPIPTEDTPCSKSMATLPSPQQSSNQCFFLDTDANKNNQTLLPSSYNYVSFQQPNDELQLDQEALSALCGKRGLKRRAVNEEEFKIIDINSSELNPDSQELLTKNLTSEQPRPSHKSKDGPTSQQKRKHQIIYLAHQAKEQEIELQNTWANNRMTKKQTQAKYGF